MKPLDPSLNTSLPKITENDPDDPEIKLLAMKEDAREAAHDLIPILMEKAINGKTRDALAIFEALADRSDFHKPDQKQLGQQGPMFNLNINTSDLSNMLSGLQTITNQEPIEQNRQIGHDDQFASTLGDLT